REQLKQTSAVASGHSVPRELVVAWCAHGQKPARLAQFERDEERVRVESNGGRGLGPGMMDHQLISCWGVAASAYQGQLLSTRIGSFGVAPRTAANWRCAGPRASRSHPPDAAASSSGDPPPAPTEPPRPQ